eukprot:SAG31_NODE_2394_length_5793_cov_2.006674_3_plen_53_part_00
MGCGASKGTVVDQGPVDAAAADPPSLLPNQVRSYFLVFVPTIREIRDFYREM